MRKFSGPIGSVSRVTIESQALKSNMLGDPLVRVVDVYVPTGHETSFQRRTTASASKTSHSLLSA